MPARSARLTGYARPAIFGENDERSVNAEQRMPGETDVGRPTSVILAVTPVTCRSRPFAVPQAAFATGLGIAIPSA
jgi:hypothetical protein